MVSLIQLEYIVALAQHQSFSLAAEKCFVTQPTLSMQIKKMETDLDVLLFDRSKKPITPTQVGAQLIQQAKVILAESAKIREIIQFNAQTLTGELRIGIIPSIAPYLLPKFIGQFATLYPGINIHIRELLSQDIMQALDGDQIDIGILATPLPRKDFNIFPLFYEQILIYCDPSNVLANYETVDIAEMRRKKIWLMSDGNCFRNQVINLCDLKGDETHANFHYESASIETLIKLVDVEGGLTLIPEFAANDLSLALQKNVKGFKTINPVREVSLITNRLFVKQRMIEALMSEIDKVLTPEMKLKTRGEIVEWT